jgi:hypothetical protein
MPPLARQGPKLLRQIGDRKHASSEDHEDPGQKQANGLSRLEEEDLFAEPKSSDDEPPASLPHTSQPSKPKSRARIPTKDSARDSRKPQRKSKRATFPAPSPGSYQRSQAEKAKRGFSEDKENVSSSQSLGGSQQDNPFGFDEMELPQPPPKRLKKTFDSKSRGAPVTNIHSTTVNMRVSKKAPRGYGKGSHEKPADYIEMLSDDELDALLSKDKEESSGPALRTVRSTKKHIHSGDKPIKQPLLSDKELDDLDKALKVDPGGTKSKSEDKNLRLPLLSEKELDDLYETTIVNTVGTQSKQSPTSLKPSRFLDQVDDWRQDQVPDSSLPESSAPQEALENLHSYIEKLPEEAEEGSTCAICKASVEPRKYWDFWEGKDKTIKNQNLFCRQHRTSSAWDEYRREGYPNIDWITLPRRIKEHRMDLFKILNNDKPSGYRDRYEPVALTGKAAAVPSKRSDLPDHVREELDSYALDDESIFPGYYGPHGRRVITESVMKMLKNEIKNCTDPVVQGSGPATFVQAVLVPETAILLIMQDCKVHREDAEEIREKTYDMGMLLNEEIEDELEVHGNSDDENEYGGR